MPALSIVARNLALAGGLLADYNAGSFRFYTGASPGPDNAPTGTLLVTLTLNATAFAAPVGGTATANAIGSGVAAASGVAGYMRASGATSDADFTVSISGGGGEAQLPSLSIGAGTTVSCPAFTWTQPQ